jgi:hypothetical protein
MIYKRNDKIMVNETGEVFTVFRDLGFFNAPAIIVGEKIGRLFRRDEVRPAGYTRQHVDLLKHISPPDPIPPPPDERSFL